MKPRIVVVGSSNTDMIIRLDRIPRPGETMLGGEFGTAAGGKGANQAVAAARAGGEVTFIARVGQDVFGEQAIDGFKEAGIHVEHVARDASAPSGVALIFVAKNGENSIAVASGANARLSTADVMKAGDAFVDARVVLMQLETPMETVQAAAEMAAEEEARVILNPAPARALPNELLRQVAVLTPNETEAELLTGIKIRDEIAAKVACERLIDRGVRAVILTMGARGAFVADGDTRLQVPGFRVQPVDTVAAGDVFNGALAVALGEGKPMLTAVKFAGAAAAISVTRAGAQPSAPKREEIDALLAQA